MSAALFSYRDSRNILLFARPEAVLRVGVSEDFKTTIHFVDGHVAAIDDKPTAIAERIKVAEGQADASPRPAVDGPIRFTRPSGRVVDVQDTPELFGAWLSADGKPIDGRSRTLGLISQRNGLTDLDYIQYRDASGSQLPRFALSMDRNGRAEVQVLLHGESREQARVRTIDLEALLKVIEKNSVPDRVINPEP